MLHNRIFGRPFIVNKLSGAHKVHIGNYWGNKYVGKCLEAGQYQKVIRSQRIGSGWQNIGKLSVFQKNGILAFTLVFWKQSVCYSYLHTRLHQETGPLLHPTVPYNHHLLLTQRKIRLIFEGVNRNQDDVNNPFTSKQTACKQIEKVGTNLTYIKPVSPSIPKRYKTTVRSSYFSC